MRDCRLMSTGVVTALGIVQYSIVFAPKNAQGIHYNSGSRQKLTYLCYFPGKAKWEERTARALLQPGEFK